MEKMRIEEVQSTTKKQRVATHTHIKGLGLEVLILYLPSSSGVLLCYIHMNIIKLCFLASFNL